MGTIADKLNYLNDTKKAIKTAISNRGVDISDDDTFRSYADKIDNIGETVEKTKFGASIDNLLGDVDENGAYIAPTDGFVVNLSGVKSVGDSQFNYKFYESRCNGIIANDLISVGEDAFRQAFSYSESLTTVQFDSIEEVDKPRVFYNAFENLSPYAVVSFKSLKRISGESAFEDAFATSYGIDTPLSPAEVFPALEEVTGRKALSITFGLYGSLIHTYPSLKKISSDTTYYFYSMFGNPRVGTIYNLPNVTEITGYCWPNVSNSGEIHFAAANQAVIEACEGYSYKWGWPGATIYFDL